MATPGFIYQTSAHNVSVSDNGDFFQLRNGATSIVKILEFRAWQISDTALAMAAIRLDRGTGGAGGNAMTEYEWDSGGPASSVTTFNLATTDANSAGQTLAYAGGWNILQEFVFLPTPEFQLYLSPGTNLGASLEAADTLEIGFSCVWQEYV